MNTDKLIGIFNKYPKLETFIAAGTISLKAARTILDIDRHLMYDVFAALLETGAIVAQGATSWRATQELKDFLSTRKEQRI